MPGVGVSCRVAAGSTGRRAALWRRAWDFSWSGGGVADGEDGFGGARGGVAAGAAECGAGRCLAGAVPVPVDDDAASADGAGQGLVADGAVADGGEDGAVGGGEGDLAGVDGLPGARASIGSLGQQRLDFRTFGAVEITVISRRRVQDGPRWLSSMSKTSSSEAESKSIVAAGLSWPTRRAFHRARRTSRRPATFSCSS